MNTFPTRGALALCAGIDFVLAFSFKWSLRLPKAWLTTSMRKTPGTSDTMAAESSNEYLDRLAKLVRDCDSLATLLESAFAKSKLETVRQLSKDAANSSLALKLSISMDRPAGELLESATKLRSAVSQLRLHTQRSRTDQATRVALALFEKMAEQLHGDLALAAVT